MKNKPAPIEKKPSKGLYLLIFAAGILIGAAAIYFLGNKKEPAPTVSTVKTVEQKPVSTFKKKRFTNPLADSPEYHEYDIRPVSDLSSIIQNRVDKQIAKGAANSISVYYRDLTNDQVIGINEKETFSPASLLKVPLLITILKYAEQHPSILRDKIPYNSPSEQIHKLSGISDKSALIRGRSYEIEQLLEIMVVASDNEATILLLQYIDNISPGFRTQVENALKLETPSQINYTDDYITVRRYSAFFRTLFNASYLTPAMSEKALDMLAKTGYGNGIRQAVPAQVVVSQKFGHREIDATHHQYHHFAIVYHPNKPFLIGIMTKGKSPESLQSVIAAIANTIYIEVNRQSNQKASYLSRDVD
ncbi:serine hydrolase [Owenweeksia hongkongensis]|uniref:serine hydrolase n=1 Tax=Owenweeksia hongkongensis TaxID=253245 RepID=UPI003A8FBA4D